MDEPGARALLERLSATQPPPSRVDIGLARQRGRRRLRRRRWAASVAPLLAAAAVAAIIAGTGALAGGAGTRHGGVRPAAPAVSPPHRFDPLAPYAAFGWLPAGLPVTPDGPQSLPTAVTLLAGSAAAGQFNLQVWAPGTCDLGAAQALRALRHHGQPQLNCMQNDSAGSVWYLTRPSRPVAGRPGFWARPHALAWEYAPDAWAELQTYRHGTAVPDATIAKVAAHVRYGVTAAPSVWFPYRFTGLPRSWRVTSATWRPSGGRMVGRSLAAGFLGQVSVLPGRGGCWFQRGASQRITLHGVKAVFTLFRINGADSYQGLCVPETHGTSVDFLLYRGPGQGFALGGVTGIFLHHLRLLGPDPAHWTTRPLG